MNLKERYQRSKETDKVNFKQIPCKESGEDLVAVRGGRNILLQPIWEYPVDNIEGPLYQDYVKRNPSYNRIYLRKGVSRRLRAAAKVLPDGLSLVIRAGHRPLSVQESLLRALADEFKRNKPSLTSSEALELARTYVSDPSLLLPPHCCGAAVDVDVMDDSNMLLDFGCPVNSSSKTAFLHSDEITKAQRINRDILLNAMLSAGFASFASEWWHFSYGDQNWAYFYRKPHALYGVIEPKL